MIRFRKPKTEDELTQFYSICDKAGITSGERLHSGNMRYKKSIVNGKEEIDVYNYDKYADRTILALDEEKVIGGIQYSELPGRKTKIDFIAISKRKRKKGIGKELINKLIKETKSIEYRAPFLEKVKRFYDSLGFQKAQSEYILRLKK